jgi:sugar diacid utilization regulator
MEEKILMGSRDFLDDFDYQIVQSFANNNMTIHSTSLELFVTDGTINYHLKKVRRLTGLDPYKFWDLVKLCERMKEDFMDGQ